MKTVKLSLNGQLLIPKEMLQDTGFGPGAEFVLDVTGTGLALTPVELIREKPFPPTTVDQVMGFLEGKAGLLADDETIEMLIKARLNAEDEASKR